MLFSAPGDYHRFTSEMYKVLNHVTKKLGLMRDVLWK